MPRKKSGIVHRGDSITFYGEDACAALAMIEASSCSTQREAWAMLKNKQPGLPYPDQLARELKRQKWKIPQRFQRSIDETEDNREEA